MIQKFETTLGDKTLTLETGRIAKQANGAVWIQYGETFGILEERPLIIKYLV